jgi:homoserine kinase type II
VAVYTPVDEASLSALLARYDCGRLVAFAGIAEGIENSNFRVETTAGRFVLTVFERRAPAGDLPFFMDLMAWLADRGFPAPRPAADREGRVIQTLCGKPAAIVSFLDGRPIEPPTLAACTEAGSGAARLRQAVQGFSGARPNALGVGAWRGLFRGREAAADALQPGLSALIAADLDAVEAAWPADLPQGVIHADLFPDNAFFDAGGAFAGVIDFYFACTEICAYELAVMLNAWAFEGGEVSRAKAQALVGGYEAVSPLSPAERAALPVLARGAALRFFLTRLIDWDDTPQDALVTRKDPLDYAARLCAHRAAATGTGPPLLGPAA